ncbi:MAG: hypothetical protein EOP86_09935 [Verrucomicrobiaceae bacterium]|nr:MAG: hypothetical protein EOP86_09935 [Verrucomicrobiaceae bacterium]
MIPSTKLGQARQVLEEFLAAKNWQERIQYSLSVKGLKESMAAHFKDRPDGPVPVEGISLLDSGTIPGTSRGYFGFRVRVQGYPADIPTAVEESEDGSFRVDWVPFLESYEQRLREFFENPGHKPGQFRVVLRRRHYFGPAVPGQGTARQAFGVESPMRDESWFVWADLSNPNFQNKIAAKGGAEWDVESFVVLALEWSGDEKTGQYVTIRDLVADNWQMR